MNETLYETISLSTRSSLASFAIAAVTCYPVFLLLQRLNARQSVSAFAPESHQTKQGTPTMGGVMVLLGWIVGLVFAYSQLERTSLGGGFFPQTPTAQAKLAVTFLLIVSFGLIGFLDDFVVPRLSPEKRGLGWKQKLVMQVIAVVSALSLVYGQLDLTWAMTASIVVLFFANAFNFADGLDGLGGGLAITLCVGLSALSIFQLREAVVILVAGCLTWSLVPFLFLNSPPAKIFMGDVGSLPIGAVLGWLFFDFVGEARQDVSANSFSDVSSWLMSLSFTPLTVAAMILSLVMVAELVPVPLQIFWVKVFKKKLFPYTPIHHAYEKAGLSESKVVWSFILIQAVLALLALGVAVRFLPPLAVGAQ